jgi:hypothetical protein
VFVVDRFNIRFLSIVKRLIGGVFAGYSCSAGILVHDSVRIQTVSHFIVRYLLV